MLRQAFKYGQCKLSQICASNHCTDSLEACVSTAGHTENMICDICFPHFEGILEAMCYPVHEEQELKLNLASQSVLLIFHNASG